MEYDEYIGSWFIHPDTNCYRNPMVKKASDCEEQRRVNMSMDVMQYTANQHRTNNRITRGNYDIYRPGNDNVPRTSPSNRPFIANFDHPLRRRIRELQTYNIDNILGYGPQWVNKDHLRNICSARKTIPSRDQSMIMRSSSGTNHLNVSETHVEKQKYKTLKMPKVESVIHSYVTRESTGTSSLVIDPSSPIGQSITSSPTGQSITSSPIGQIITTATVNGAQRDGSSNPRQAKNFYRDSFKNAAKDPCNEDEVLTKYCKWFDSLTSSILGDSLDDYKSRVNAKADLITDSSEPELRETLTIDKLNSQNCYSDDRHSASCQTAKESNELKNRDDELNSKEEEKDVQNIPDIKEDSQELCGEDSHKNTRTATRQVDGEEQRSGKNSELFVDKLVSIVGDYIKYRRNEPNGCQKDKPKEKKVEDTKETIDNIDDKAKEHKRRAKIEVLRRLVAQQESTLAKLKAGQAGVIFDKEHRLVEQKVKFVKNKRLHHDILGMSQCEDDDVSQKKKIRLSIEKLNGCESKTSWKKRWLSDWSCCTEDQCMSKADLTANNR